MNTERLRVGWWRSVFAVLVGGFFSGLVVGILQLVLADAVGWPEFRSAELGLGWPWRVDGLWSLAANVGPALVYGVLFTWGADIVLRIQPDVTAVRPSLVLVAASLTLFPLGAAGTLVAVNFVPPAILVVAIRTQAARPRRPIRWKVQSIGLVLAACLALTATTVSYGKFNALTAEPAEITASVITIPVRGIGNDIVNLRNVRVLDVRGVTVGVWNPGRTDISAVNGASVLPAETVQIAVQVPSRCASAQTFDRLEVRMDVGADRELQQTVRLESPVTVCA